jgi:ELWxxDGT repeat protein
MTTVLFSAKNAANGTELWVTDGTDAGTHLVTDIYSGSTGSYPPYVTSLGNGRAVFAASDPTHGKEVWVTDGTAAGTTLLKDINPGSMGSFPGGIMHGGFFALGNGQALFAADDGNTKYGTELWITDGTAAGTHLVKDINPGSAGDSNPSEFAALGNGKVLFQADDGTHGFELWVTDGTSAGTMLVKDIYASFPNSYPSHITALGNGKAVFQASNGTHSVNGSTPYGNELWVTDGSPTGTTKLVKDIYPGPGASTPGGIAVVGGILSLGNGKAVFQANEPTDGTELWVTDGSLGGTTLLKDIYPGPTSSVPYELTLLGIGKAVFQAEDKADGTELWITDGSAAGTMLLKDINPGTGPSDPRHLTSLGNGKVVFEANDGSDGTELWVTDGTAAGTMLVEDIDPVSGSGPTNITAVGNGRAVFQADDGTNGVELWITDGTAGGTHLVKDIYPGTDSSSPKNFAALAQGLQSPAVLNDCGWAQGWGSPDNVRFTADVNNDGNADYVGFGSQFTFFAYGGTFSNSLGQAGPGFSTAVAAVQDFGTNEGYTASVQRGVAATGAGVGDTIYGQGFAGVYWYSATGQTPAQDVTGTTYEVLHYQTSPNFYGNFGSLQGWTPDNGFQILKATTGDAFASILGFGNDGIIVGPQAFAPGATASNSYLVPLAAGNNSGWKQSVDIRTFTDARGKVIDLNGDGIANFVGMGPQGLAFAFGNHSGPGGGYSLGTLQIAHVGAGGTADLGEAQGWTDTTTLRYIVADPKTGRDDILAFGQAGVLVAMGQDPATHAGEPFAQLYLAMADFGSNQGWSVSQTPRIVGDVNGDGIPDIVGFGAANTFVAVGSRDASGNLHFALDPNETIGDFGYTEGWSGSNPQTVRTLADFKVNGFSHSDLVLSGAFNTQLWQFG